MKPKRRVVMKVTSIGRFLIGSALLMAGWMILLSAPITLVGLPIGLMVLAAGLELMKGPSNRRT
jgi:hypothetical protein